MAKAPSLRKARSKGTERMRKLTPVYSGELGKCKGTLHGALRGHGE